MSIWHDAEIQVTGNLVYDARKTAVGSRECVMLRIARNRHYKRNDGQLVTETDYYNVDCFGCVNDAIMKYLKKGQMVVLRGDPQFFNDKNGQQAFVIKATKVIPMISSRNSETTQSDEPKQKAVGQPVPNQYMSFGEAEAVADDEDDMKL